MSEFKSDYDSALRPCPWVTKAVQGTPYLLKYTTFDKRSIFLVSNLQSTYYEILRSPDVLVRNKEARKALPPVFGFTEAADGGESIVTHADAAEEVEKVRSKLEKMITAGEGWDGVDISMGEEDDFYDVVINLEAENFSWILKLTKIIDAQALVLLRDHLTIPLLGLVGAFGNVLEQTEMDIGKITKTIDASSLTASRRLAPLLSSTMIAPRILSGMQRWSAGWSGKKGKELPPVMTEWVGEESEESVKNELMPPDLPAKATRSQDTEKQPSTRNRKRTSTPPSPIAKLSHKRVVSPISEPSSSPVEHAQPADPGRGSDTEEAPVDQSNTDPQEEEQEDDDEDEDWDSDMTVDEDDEEAVKLHEERRTRKADRSARKRRSSNSPQKASGKAAKRAKSASVQSEVLSEADKTAKASELRKAARQEIAEDVKKGKDEITRLEQETRDRLRTGIPAGVGTLARGRGRGRGKGRPIF